MNTQTIHIRPFLQTIYSWENTKDNYPNVLEVSLSKYSFNESKVILKAVRELGIDYNSSKEVYEAVTRLYSKYKDLDTPNLLDIYENDKGFQDLFTDLGFDLIDKEGGTTATLYFKSEIPLTKEEAKSIRSEIEDFIYPYLKDWVNENKDELIDELNKVQDKNVSRASSRQARRTNVKDIGIFGYIALDSWGKPLVWGKDKSDVSDVDTPRARYYIMLNDGTFENISMEN